MKFVDPKTDIAFKKIFGNQSHTEILIEFLNKVLDLPYPISEIKILNPYQAPRLNDLKETTLDIRAKDQNGHEFIVEMQVEKETGFHKRVIYYSSKTYVQQLDKAEAYHRLNPVIFLGILDFKIFDHASPYSRHLILNQETSSHDLKDLEFNFIELPKFVKTEGELATTADKWLFFLKNADNLDHVPVHADTDALKHAYEIASQHLWSKQELEVYDYQGMQIGRMRGIVENALLEGMQAGMQKGVQEGIEQGLEQGRQQGLEQGLEQGCLNEKRQTARKMLQKGLDIALIADVTGLSEAEIKRQQE
jgi:predicted transposase/invertase (TIGR01784 family)